MERKFSNYYEDDHSDKLRDYRVRETRSSQRAELFNGNYIPVQTSKYNRPSYDDWNAQSFKTRTFDSENPDPKDKLKRYINGDRHYINYETDEVRKEKMREILWILLYVVIAVVFVWAFYNNFIKHATEDDELSESVEIPTNETDLIMEHLRIRRQMSPRNAETIV